VKNKWGNHDVGNSNTSQKRVQKAEKALEGGGKKNLEKKKIVNEQRNLKE